MQLHDTVKRDEANTINNNTQEDKAKCSLETGKSKNGCENENMLRLQCHSSQSTNENRIKSAMMNQQQSQGKPKNIF